MTNERTDEQLATQEPKKSRRREVEHTTETSNDTKKTRWVQLRILPIWIRIVIVLALFVAAAIAGAMIGYGVIGDGAPKDVLKAETWQHIFDIMNGKQ